MLPLSSMSRAMLTPVASDPNSTIWTRSPATSSSKSDGSRPSTGRPRRSWTTAVMRTRSTPLLNVAFPAGDWNAAPGSCHCWPSALSPADQSTAIIRASVPMVTLLTQR